MKLTQAIVKELLDYDPETGKLFWKKRNSKWFYDDARWTAEQSCKRWNSRFAQTECFKQVNKKRKTLHGCILSKIHKTHRIIWLWMTGEWPEDEIDHENGDYTDNRFENLRDVTGQINRQNMKTFSNNTSGHVGVSWLKSYGKWEAYIWSNYKKINLGYYDTFEEAVTVRQAAEIKYGFHPNHGKR